jgi:hypothetical protein
MGYKHNSLSHKVQSNFQHTRYIQTCEQQDAGQLINVQRVVLHRACCMYHVRRRALYCKEFYKLLLSHLEDKNVFLKESIADLFRGTYR